MEDASDEKGMNPKLVTLAAIGALLLGGILVAYNYHLRNVRERYVAAPPKLGELMQYLEATNRTGEQVSLEQLKGKVWLCSYIFTDCPSQCLGVAAEMKNVYEEFGENERFHLVSVSVNPSGDTPEKMDAFVKRNGVDVPQWWFLTGDDERIHSYMRKYFKFSRVEENTDPKVIATQGRFSHDAHVALVDGEGRIRGYYNLLDYDTREQQAERLSRDLKWIMEEEMGEEN
jgi:protein SCO1/2